MLHAAETQGVQQIGRAGPASVAGDEAPKGGPAVPVDVQVLVQALRGESSSSAGG
jgi:hypothetical protein